MENNGSFNFIELPFLATVLHHESIISPLQGYYFHTENPFKDWPGAFEEGLKKMKEGDLPVTILYLEAAILQEPNDAEVFLIMCLLLVKEKRTPFSMQ